MLDLQTIQHTAAQIAQEAGALALARWEQPLDTRLKGARDVVTAVDYASQQLIKERVHAHYPSHSFIAEESDDWEDATSDVIWLIDPIDGTSNYSRHMSIWCISIGVAVDGIVQVGVVFDPVRGELFSARRGAGATVNGRPLSVSTAEQLSEAVFAFDWGRPPALRRKNHQMFGTLMEHVRTPRSLGSAAIAMCWTAAGRIDAYFNLMLGAWDVAAASLILHEAGGKTTGLDGTSFDITKNKTWYLSSNGLVHQPLADLINQSLA